MRTRPCQVLLEIKIIEMKQFLRFTNAFFIRLTKGQLRAPIYLTYFYSYLYVYDMLNGTNFTHSQSAEETGVPKGGTGNFPAHPRIVEKFLQKSGIALKCSILDVGSGSGIALHTARKLGFSKLTGIEYSQTAYNASKQNLDNDISLIYGDALDIDVSKYEAIFFFNPFRDALATMFFEKLPLDVKTIIAINYDPQIEPILKCNGFDVTFVYKHPFYDNFNGKVFVR